MDRESHVDAAPEGHSKGAGFILVRSAAPSRPRCLKALVCMQKSRIKELEEVDAQLVNQANDNDMSSAMPPAAVWELEKPDWVVMAPPATAYPFSTSSSADSVDSLQLPVLQRRQRHTKPVGLAEQAVTRFYSHKFVAPDSAWRKLLTMLTSVEACALVAFITIGLSLSVFTCIVDGRRELDGHNTLTSAL